MIPQDSPILFGRCALLGDSAHAMYPFGSNGASQAILDARVFAYNMAISGSIEEALHGYEAHRRPVTTSCNWPTAVRPGRSWRK